MLSSDDPVRVFQRYSTLNAISGGRAEVILGRGSSIDSFPLFGYDLADYEELFEEKASLFAELLKGGPVTWQGKTRASLYDQDVVPHTESGPFPAWIGVGRQPAIGHPRRSLWLLADARHHRRDPGALRALLPALPPSPGALRANRVAGRRALAGPCRRHRREGPRRVLAALPGGHPPRQRDPRLSRPDQESFAYEVGPHGALYVGSPETVAQKIAANLTALGATRFDLKYGMGGLSHEALMTNIELYGTQVVPRVRELLASYGRSGAPV